MHHLNLPKQQHFIWGLGLRASPSNFIQTQATVNFLPHQETDSVYSGFLQDEIPILANKLSLTIGTKLVHNNFSGFDYEPGARLLLTPSDRQSFWAAATRAVRTPSRLDQDLALTGFVAAGPPPIFIEIAGNPKFAPERLIGYEAGYRALVSSSFYMDISTFFNNYRGLLSFGPASISFAQSPPPRYTYILIAVPWANGLLGNTDGVEVSPNWKVTDWWQLKGSYSYLQMHLKDRPGITDTGTAASDIGSSPRHEIVIQSLFRLPWRFELDPTYRFMSALSAQSVKKYSTMDVHFGRSFAEDHFELSLTGQDLFRPSQQEFGLGVPNAPNVGIKRAVYAKLTWRR